MRMMRAAMTEELKHGEVTNNGRWCRVCKHSHGPLYICEHYPAALQAELQQKIEKFQANVKSRAWWKKQQEVNKWDQDTLEFAMACYGEPTED
jgi:predicted translin family RNA/ssDNA-binding protein